jgi:hypothetical protein
VPWPAIRHKGELSERRAEELREEQGTVRCSACAWTFTGSMAGGIVAARQHRLATHPDLPGKTPRLNRKRTAQGTGSDARPKPTIGYELRDRLIGLLKEAAKPLTAKELAALAGDVSPNAATTTLVWARKDGTPLHRSGAAWAYGAGEDVADPERARIHEQILTTLASADGLLAAEIAKRVGLGTVSCGNHLKRLEKAGDVVKLPGKAPRRWALAEAGRTLPH